MVAVTSPRRTHTSSTGAGPPDVVGLVSGRSWTLVGDERSSRCHRQYPAAHGCPGTCHQRLLRRRQVDRQPSACRVSHQVFTFPPTWFSASSTIPSQTPPRPKGRIGTKWWSSRATATQFALGGYTVILDGPMFPDGADGVAEICGRRNVSVHYTVLRADLPTCLERARRRDPAGPPDLDAFTALHAKFMRFSVRAKLTSSTPLARLSK